MEAYHKQGAPELLRRTYPWNVPSTNLGGGPNWRIRADGRSFLMGWLDVSPSAW